MKYKRGALLGDSFMLISFFILFFLVAGAAVAGILLFYGNSFDFRQQEAEILSYRLMECIYNKGVGDIIKDCNLNKELINNEFLVHILKKEEYVFTLGDKEICFFESGENLPKCSVRKIGDYEIIVGSYHKSRRIGI